MPFPTIKTHDKDKPCGPGNLPGADCDWSATDRAAAQRLTADGTHVALVGVVSDWRTPNGATGTDVGFCIVNQNGIAHADPTYAHRHMAGVRILFGGEAVSDMYFWVADINDYTATLAREQAAAAAFNARLAEDEARFDAEWGNTSRMYRIRVVMDGGCTIHRFNTPQEAFAAMQTNASDGGLFVDGVEYHYDVEGEGDEWVRINSTLEWFESVS